MTIIAVIMVTIVVISAIYLFKGSDKKILQKNINTKSAEDTVKNLKKQGFNIKYEINSFSNPRVLYTVDPAAVTCTCDNFDRRGHFSTNDPRRLCKHLIAVYAGLNDYPAQLEKYGKIIKSLFSQKRAFDPAQNMATDTINKNTYVFVWEDQSEWVNVYDEINRFGYNTFEGRWSYGKPPANEAQIIRIIEKIK